MLKCQPSNSNYLSTLTRAQTLMGPKGQYCNRASEPHVGNLAVLKAAIKSKSGTMCSLYKTTTSITKSANSYSVVKEQRSHSAKASDITMYSCGKGKVNFNILNACCASIIHYQRIKTTTQHQAVTMIWHRREIQTDFIIKTKQQQKRKKQLFLNLNYL